MPRIFHLVINPASLEYYEDIKQYVMGLKYFQYMLVCEHIGQEEKHYHMLLQLRDSLPKLSVKKLHGAHIIPKTYGSTQKLKEYIECEDEKHKSEGVTAVKIDEEGELKQQGGYSVSELKDCRKDEVPAILYNIKNRIDNEYKSTAKFHSMLDEIRNNLLTSVKVIYFIGRPGSGKTYNAYLYAFSLGYKNEDITKVSIQNNFFEFVGSINDKCLVIEEFRPSQLHPSSLLQFTDKYGYSCPIKGGFKYVRPETIIICSIIHPKRLYSEEKQELNEQFTRRISHCFEVLDNHVVREISLDYDDFYYTHNVINHHEYEIHDSNDDTTVIIN